VVRKGYGFLTAARDSPVLPFIMRKFMPQLYRSDSLHGSVTSCILIGSCAVRRSRIQTSGPYISVSGPETLLTLSLYRHKSHIIKHLLTSLAWLISSYYMHNSFDSLGSRRRSHRVDSASVRCRAVTCAGVAAGVAGLAGVVGVVPAVVRRAGEHAAPLAPQVEEPGGAAEALALAAAQALPAGRRTPLTRPRLHVAVVTEHVETVRERQRDRVRQRERDEER